MRPRRIGVFGGSFDPPHAGHLHVAKAALRLLRLDEVVLVPCGRSAYGKRLSPARLRLRWLRRLIWGMAKAKLSRVDLRGSGVSRSYLTLRALRKQKGQRAQFFLLLGQDQIRPFVRWRRPGELAKQAQIVIFPRGPKPLSQAEKRIMKKFGMSLAKVSRYDISSSDLRRAQKAL